MQSVGERRERLPSQSAGSYGKGLLSFLKQCIGKELSKVTMPVDFNEPLSFLQRLAESMEYSQLLDKACHSDEAIDRMQYVAAFAISALSSNDLRIKKPFNPIQGETYQLDTAKFKMVCEQVSHHPPVSAFHAESAAYRFYGSVQPTITFKGRHVQIHPQGVFTVELIERNEIYTWSNVDFLVYVSLEPWIEQSGNMTIMNHTSGYSCELSFKSVGWFSRKNLHRVEGFILDQNKCRKATLHGKWSEQFKCNQGPLRQVDSTILWQAEPRSSDSDKYYNFTQFAVMLNEMNAELEKTLCRTDSRFRWDIRLLEEGRLEESGMEKARLEQKQRDASKSRGGRQAGPVWFESGIHPHTKKDGWFYRGGFWERSGQVTTDLF